VKVLVEELKKNYKVAVSNDPGRYLCNYIYFSSLQNSEQYLNVHPLFVHVPEYSVINQ
jgi:pyrrolidone-carboxylate peptidase